MNRLATTGAALAFSILPAVASAQVGERCRPGDTPPRAALDCRPALITLQGTLVREWDWDPSQILNADKGDTIVSPGCGLIGNILRKVTPPQRYQHAGIMVQNRYKIRHSTGSQDRIMYTPFDAVSTPYFSGDGVRPDVMRFVWPGAITEWVDQAYEGSYHQDPELGVPFRIQAFNKVALSCGDDSQLTAPKVIKPPPELVGTASAIRNRLEAVADRAETIKAHYRWYLYSKAAFDEVAPASGRWEAGTRPSVCSSFIWRAMKESGVTMEGGVTEPDEAKVVMIDALTPDGLYVYTEQDRKDAGDFLFKYVDAMVYEVGGVLGDLFYDISDDTANQMANCFGFDFCGNGEGPPAACTRDSEEDAKDSKCWQLDPGVGHAVSPDDIFHWDLPPGGPYGHQEDLQPFPGEYIRVHRWQAAAGSGTVRGIVRKGGMAVQGALVQIEGLKETQFTNSAGQFEFVGVPAGPWALNACKDDSGANSIFSLAPSATHNATLDLAGTCGPPVKVSRWRRLVNIKVHMNVVDWERFGDNETGAKEFPHEIILDPFTTTNHTFSDSFCVGDEVVINTNVAVELNVHDRTVRVAASAKMLEGASCSNEDHDGSGGTVFDVGEDSTAPGSFSLRNDEEDDDDTATVTVTVENALAPAP